jgi:hypothetical protein
VSRLRVAFLCAAVVVFVTTAALWPAKPSIEEKLLDRFDQELGLIPRFIGAKPALPCGRAGTSAPPVFCPDDLKDHLGEKELVLEAREARETGSLRPRFLRNLLRAQVPGDREILQRELESQLEENPNSAEIQNDLAVLHLIRANKGEDPKGFAEAFDLLDRAAKSAKPPLEVLLNRTFVLTSLGLRHEARLTASRLASSSSPEWAKIAFDLLDAKTLSTRDDPANLRARAEALLGEWGTFTEARDLLSAATKLEEARGIALRLARGKGDLLLVDAIMSIDEAATNPKEQKLARGHKSFFQARGSQIYSNCESGVALDEARSTLWGESPFVFWVLLDQAICAYFDKNYAGAIEYLDRIRPDLTQRSYLALMGRRCWIRGLVKLRQGRFLEAEAEYQLATGYFEKVGEQCHIAAVNSQRARNFEQLGVQSEAWRYRLMALRDLDSVGEPVRRYDLLEEAGEAAILQGRQKLALAYLDQRFRWAQQAGKLSPELRDLPIFTLLAYSSFLQDLGKLEAAKALLETASNLLLELPAEATTRVQLELSLAAQQAALPLFEWDSRSALDAIDQALSFFGGDDLSAGDALFRLDLLWKRSQIHERQGDITNALDDLNEGLVEVGALRIHIESFDLRARLQAMARKLANSKIGLELDKLNDPWRALSTVESSSNQAIYDLAQLPAEAQHVHRQDLLKIPLGTRILRYFALDDRILIFSLNPTGLTIHQTRFDTAGVKALSIACQNETTNRQALNTPSCLQLARMILPHDLQPYEKRLLVIPDTITRAIPFSHLMPQGTTLPLAAVYDLEFALSLPLLLNSPSTVRRNPGPSHFLLISDPAFDSILFPSLQRLSAAPESTVSAHNSSETILRGKEATKARVLQELSRATIAQFETHSVIAMDAWNTQGLVLAGSPSRDAMDSILRGSDLENQDISNLHLVILGACSSRPASVASTSETSGPAAIFMGRGVPYLIATTRPIGDSQAAEFLLAFNSRLKSGLSYQRAFHESQKSWSYTNQRLDFQLYTNKLAGITWSTNTGARK